ncbi:MAG: alpha/beta hydrolase [Erysipelotrichaceae bacterium]|nr:alpha/beta hydrolase [Erysipelotrichaceae bacterium]
MLYNAKEHTIAIDNTTLDYITFGKGNKPLVIIPGLSFNRVKGASLPLAYMYRIFTKEYKVYIFDRKNDIPTNYSIEDIANDTAKIMCKLDLYDSSIIGISQGGMIASYIAIHYSQLVSKLVLGATTSRTNECVRERIGKWIELAQNNDYTGIMQDVFMSMYSSKYIQKYKLILPILIRTTKPKSMDRFLILARSCLSFDIYEDLPKIQCPTLVLGGMQDSVVSSTASFEIQEKIQCDMYMYEEYGHAVYEEAKDFNTRIYTFLK